MSRTGAASQPHFNDSSDGFFDWIQTHTRQVTIAAVFVAATAVGFWLYTYSREKREQNASLRRLGVRQTVQQGNLPLAQSDLEKLITRYSGTQAATQASLDLASLYYEQGQFQKGVTVLEQLIRSEREPAVLALAEGMLAAGYEGMEKPADAAAHYRRAAEHAVLEDDRNAYRASEARALMAAGKTADAIKLWRELAAAEGTESAEARIRLGELEAAPRDPAGAR